jgi:hypothetical protein
MQEARANRIRKDKVGYLVQLFFPEDLLRYLPCDL